VLTPGVPAPLEGGRALEARDAAAISLANTMRFFPFVPLGGYGAHLHGPDGRQWLDFSGSWSVANIGYGDPRVAEAVAQGLHRGGYAGVASAVIPSAVDLAERLIELVPSTRPAKVWFGHSGSDANEVAARLARRSTGRKRIISFIGGYHGATDGSAALSGHSGLVRIAPTEGSVKVPYPNAYRPRFGLDAVSEEQAILQYLEDDVLKAISPSEETAAILVEAIQSDSGDICPSAHFLVGLESICRRHGILLILDEVKVGMGRTGDWFAFQAAGVVPDLVVIGKAMGGGLPLSAIVGAAWVLDAAPTLAALTTSGNPFSCAAGLAVLDVMHEQGLVANAAQVGVHLRMLLDELATRHPMIGDVRGRGLVSGVELVRDRDTKEPASRDAALVSYRAAELGLVVFYVGMDSNVLEITPPLVLTRDEAELGVEILDQALSDVETGKVAPEVLDKYRGW
jgi:4-aminobutyrate aminotransferase